MPTLINRDSLALDISSIFGKLKQFFLNFIKVAFLVIRRRRSIGGERIIDKQDG